MLWGYSVRQRSYKHNVFIFRISFVVERFITIHSILHDHPYYRVCPDILSLVCDPLSGNGCGSPNHTLLIIYFCLFTIFILETKERHAL